MRQRTKAEVDLIEKNLLGAVACKTEEEFKAWFDKTYPVDQTSSEPERPEKKRDDGERV
jgi:hypothetical protein